MQTLHRAEIHAPGTGPGVPPPPAAAPAAMARMMLRAGASAGHVGDTEGEIAESV